MAQYGPVDPSTAQYGPSMAQYSPVWPTTAQSNPVLPPRRAELLRGDPIPAPPEDPEDPDDDLDV